MPAQEQTFDTFLSHVSEDKPVVRELADALTARGIRPWFDERELVPGIPRDKELARIATSFKSVLMIVGPAKTGPWVDSEMRDCLELFVNYGVRMIPVVLPGGEILDLPEFILPRLQWIDLRMGLTDAGTDLLQNAIAGVGGAPPSKLLMDGYNLVHSTHFEPLRGRALPALRLALLKFLDERLSTTERSGAVVVFDGGGVRSPEHHQFHRITVRFPSGDQPADEMIDALIREEANPRSLTVVSSDLRIQSTARRRGARAVDSDEWLGLLQNRDVAVREQPGDIAFRNRRVAAFARRFPPAHLDLACHAALPIALTPDLMYQLAAHFRTTVDDQPLGTRWEAVADVLLSGLCRDQGGDIYEMHSDARAALLQRLGTDDRFGPRRERELAEFVLGYVAPMSVAPSLDRRRFAAAQRAAALTFFDPVRASAELAQTLANVHQHDPAEQVRIARLVHDVSAKLPEADLLQPYARSLSQLAHGNVEAAADEFRPAFQLAQETAVLEADLESREFVIAGIRMPVAPQVLAELRKRSREDTPQPTQRPINAESELRFEDSASALVLSSGVSDVALVPSYRLDQHFHIVDVNWAFRQLFPDVELTTHVLDFITQMANVEEVIERAKRVFDGAEDSTTIDTELLVYEHPKYGRVDLQKLAVRVEDPRETYWTVNLNLLTDSILPHVGIGSLVKTDRRFRGCFLPAFRVEDGQFTQWNQAFEYLIADPFRLSAPCSWDEFAGKLKAANSGNDWSINTPFEINHPQFGWLSVSVLALDVANADRPTAPSSIRYGNVNVHDRSEKFWEGMLKHIESSPRTRRDSLQFDRDRNDPNNSRLDDSEPDSVAQGDQKQSVAKIKILFVAANPQVTDNLAIDARVRAIGDQISAAEHRDSMELITLRATRAGDLIQALLQHKPHIVQFGAQGAQTDGIMLVNDDGKASLVSNDQLRELFRAYKGNIRLVVLNGGFVSTQANAITEHIDCVIGIPRAVPDEAAIDFATSLYRAIGFGRSVKNAFDQGVSLMLKGIGRLKGIGGENMPILHSRHGVDAAEVVLIEPNVDIDTIRATEPVVDNDLGTHIDSAAIKLWRDKIAFLEKELAISSDPAQKFSIEQQIKVAKQKIEELRRDEG